MVRRTTARRNVSRGTTRKFIWARSNEAVQVTGDAVANDLLLDFETAYGAQLIGCTIVRIRGYMYAAATEGVSNTADQFRFAARVSSGQVNVGVLDQTLSPWADENADWMLWEPFATVNSPVVASADGELVARRVDIKAARKLGELGERLVLFLGGNPGAPLITWNVGWDLSIGVKLP